jgi:7-cyano-7-deazaguanine synthase
MRAVLLSGGIDSTALCYICRPDLAVTVDYGQVVARSEIAAARAVCSELDIRHRVLRCDCSILGKGSLIGGRASSKCENPEWWPYRNQLLITFAASMLIDESPVELLLGTVKGDGKQHKDGTRRFIRQMNALLACQEGQVEVRTPFIDSTSEQVLRNAGIPRSLLGWTVSCNTSELQCGNCLACIKRAYVLRTASFQRV